MINENETLLLQRLEEARQAAVKQVEEEFIARLYTEGIKKGRDIEVRATQEHEEGIRKLNGG